MKPPNRGCLKTLVHAKRGLTLVWGVHLDDGIACCWKAALTSKMAPFSILEVKVFAAIVVPVLDARLWCSVGLAFVHVGSHNCWSLLADEVKSAFSVQGLILKP